MCPRPRSTMPAAKILVSSATAVMFVLTCSAKAAPLRQNCCEKLQSEACHRQACGGAAPVCLWIRRRPACVSTAFQKGATTLLLRVLRTT